MSCEQCTDSPWLNLSSEVPDRDRNINIVNFVQRPPLGWEYRAVACQKTCVSEVSQEDANECALALAQECLFRSWEPFCQNPPCSPFGPFEPPAIYTNSAQTCIIQCSNGQEVSVGSENTFSWTVPAGTVVALTQLEANTLANSLACAQARNHRICISSTLAGGCIDTPYRQRIIATGGVPAFFPFTGINIPFGCSADATAGDRGAFSPIPYTWSLVGGALPPGLELRPCTGYIKGTPTTAGTYSFTVKAVDAIGSFQIKTLTLSIVEITTDADLPDAHTGQEYLEQLVQNGGDPFIERWTIVEGELPPGLELSELGIISGTPTGPSDISYQFTARVTIGPIVCEKEFNIEISSVRLLAYWKLDETTGNRADSKGDNELVPNGTVGFNTGKISNAFEQTTVGTNRIETSQNSSLIFDPAKGMTACGWFYPTSTGTFQGFFSWLLYNNLSIQEFDIDLQKLTALDPPPARLYASVCDTVLATCYNIKLDITTFYDTWNFFRVWFDPADNKLRLQINNGAQNEVLVGVLLAEQTTGRFEIGRGGPNYRVDEVAIYEGVLDDADATDLYNGGTGKTYPDVPHA